LKEMIRLILISFLASSVAKKCLTPIEKIEQSEPYRFFLSTVHGISDQINAISLKGIFLH
jgi:hypothetical protein